MVDTGENNTSKITQWLSRSSDSQFSAYAIFAAFLAYFCMYAFRKPFTVGGFAGDGILGMDYKTSLIVFQVIGYTLSKFLGIKIVSETSGKNRAFRLITMILIAEVSLLLFAFTPAPYNIFFLFLNGVPLGMVWGLVFGFLEGRHTSELLGAGLSASYILASGFVKTVGQLVMGWGVSEFWMPAVTGLLFALPFGFSVFLLNQIPPPTKADEKLRTKRAPMYSKDRWKFFKTYAPGLIPLTGLYILLTGYRSFRDDFARQIWDALGYKGQASIYTLSELPVALSVLIALSLIFLIKDNKKAMRVIHYFMIFGAILIGASTLAFQSGLIGPVTWMVLLGMGLYLGYVPYGCVLFDRLIAAVGFVGTAGFMIYLTDAFGYVGSVSIMLYKNFAQAELSWLKFFINLSYLTSVVCTVCFALSLAYFAKQSRLGNLENRSN